MAYAQFISTDYIFQWTTIPNDVDVNIVTKFIRKAQDINIQSILGEDLYFKLMNDIINNGGSTGQYLTLMNNCIQPAQAEWTVFHALPSLFLRITNKSVVKKEGENSMPTSLKEMEFLRTEFLNSAEYYQERIREYLLNNQSAFPELFTTSGVDRILPSTSNLNSGIYTARQGSWLNSFDIDYGSISANWPSNRN